MVIPCGSPQEEMSFTSAKATVADEVATNPARVPAEEDRNHTRLADEPPFRFIVEKLDVALARNCAEVEAFIVKAPVVEAEAEKTMDCEPPPAPEVFNIVRFLNAL